MKKIYMMFMALSAMLAFSSCDETWDDNPVLKGHEGEKVVDFLNPPVLGSASVTLTEENANGSFHLTASQPDFGYAAAATYEVLVSLTEDFAVSESLPTTFSLLSEVNPVNGEVATAMSNMLGITSSDQVPTPYMPVYMRLKAYVPQSADNTVYLSNIVKFDQVKVDYLAILLPDMPSGLFLRGAWNEWGAGSDAEFLTTTTKGEYILRNVTMAAGAEFKVADANWGPVNLGGSGDLAFGKEYKLEGGDNPANIKCPSDFTGNVYLYVKGASYSILFSPTN